MPARKSVRGLAGIAMIQKGSLQLDCYSIIRYFTLKYKGMISAEITLHYQLTLRFHGFTATGFNSKISAGVAYRLDP